MNRRTALRTLAGAASLAPLAMLANESSAPSSAKNQEAIDPVAQPRLPRVCVHSDGHLLQLDDGRPFFWLGDTAWELIHRATRDECSYYLATRGRQGFTVIQTVVLAEFDGLNEPDALRQRPFIDNDPLRPNEAYFDRVVEIVDEAAARGLYVALLPTWGDKLTAPWGTGPRVFRSDNLPVARAYARYLAGKLKERTNVVWMLGGDRPARVDGRKPSEWPNNQALASGFASDYDWRPVWREIATGLAEGAGAAPVCLYHPQGGDWTTSQMLPDERWLSINGMQSGHGGGHDQPVWDLVTRDYALNPAKPTLDLEPNYEDHPYNPWPRWDPATGYFRDYDVRKQCWRSVLAGACGVTYGHHAVWQLCGDRFDVINHADRDWRDALNRPGGNQVRFLRDLLESRPFFRRVPDQTLIASDAGKGGDHIRAARDRDGTYALVYIPRNDQRVTVNLAALPAKTLRAWWYDPRNGISRLLGEIPAVASEFTIPPYGPDWVLVFDDPAAGYPPPGLKRLAT
jgi:hypothetical protein